ncbi:ABC transporter permease [Ochrobactrum sp. XJ1]|nr:ABC transporter permease [Ochrobactrum sp. XJ1]
MTLFAKNKSGVVLISPPLALLLVGFVVPTILMFVMSLRSYTSMQGLGTEWTLANYAVVLTDGYYLEIIGRTLALGAVVTVTCLLIGFPLALFIVRSSPKMQTATLLLVIFPLLLNIVVRSYGWMILLAPRGLVNDSLIQLGLVTEPLDLMYNLTGVIIGLTQIYLPFMVLLLVPALQNIPADVEAAAQTLLASRPQVFFSITIPLALPGIITGSILVFVLAISALVTPRMLGGPTYAVMATQIYDEFMTNLNWPAGAALAFVLTFIALFLIWGANRVAANWTKGFPA